MIHFPTSQIRFEYLFIIEEADYGGSLDILLNVFLAIAVDNLGETEEAAPAPAVEKTEAAQETKSEARRYPFVPEGYFVQNQEASSEASELSSSQQNGSRADSSSELDVYSNCGRDDSPDSLHSESMYGAKEEQPRWRLAAGMSEPYPPYRSLYMFRRENKFRVLLHRICCDRSFRAFILVCIIVSSALLAAMDPVRASMAYKDIVRRKSDCVCDRSSADKPREGRSLKWRTFLANNSVNMRRLGKQSARDFMAELACHRATSIISRPVLADSGLLRLWLHRHLRHRDHHEDHFLWLVDASGILL